MARAVRAKTIKSASRILEILELFGEKRSSVTVMDVSRALGYPQSSTSELLSCLVAHGYLRRDRTERAFRPTPRVPLLGAWVEPSLFRSGRLLTMIDDLHDRTGHAVVLGTMIDAQVSHAHVVGTVPNALGCHSTHRLLHSPIGRTLISALNPTYVRKLAHRLNAEGPIEDVVRHDTLATELESIRKQGIATGLVAADWACISVLIPQSVDHDPLALAIVGPSKQMDSQQDLLARALRSTVALHIEHNDMALAVSSPMPERFYANA